MKEQMALRNEFVTFLTFSIFWNYAVGLAQADMDPDMEPCAEWRLPVPAHASRSCALSGELVTTCNITCDFGYYFHGANMNKEQMEYSCTSGIWSPMPTVMPACMRIDYCQNKTCEHGGMCKEMFHDSRCVCEAGYAGAACENEINECDSSPCMHGGTCFDDVNKFRCRCDVDNYVGVMCEKEKIRNPVVDSLSPTFGPLAGKTVITLTGKQFIYPVESVFITKGNKNYFCHVTYSERNKIIAETPACHQSDVGQDLKVNVVYAGGLTIQTEQTFQYRNNPRIDKVHPQATIIEGGTTITVEGDYLDSVASPWLEVTMIYTRRMKVNGVMKEDTTTQVFSAPCPTKTANQLICLTPKLRIPPEFQTLLDNDGSTMRRLLAVSESLINFSSGDDELSFYLGVLFDGLTMYSNLAEHEDLTEYGKLNVYRTPDLRLYDPKDVMPFEKHKTITIIGENLNAELFLPDYVVKIGMDVCEDLTMEGAHLTCMPPQAPPQKREDNLSPNQMVMVELGANVEYSYGQMHYDSNDITWIVVGSVLAVLVATALFVVLYFVIKRRRRIRPRHTSPLFHPGFNSAANKNRALPRVMSDKTGPDDSYEHPVNSKEKPYLSQRNSRDGGEYYDDKRTNLPFGSYGRDSGRFSPTTKRGFESPKTVQKRSRMFRKNSKKPKLKKDLHHPKKRLNSGAVPPAYLKNRFPGNMDSDDASYLSIISNYGEGSDNEAYVTLADLFEDENFYVEIADALKHAKKTNDPKGEFCKSMRQVVSRISQQAPANRRNGAYFSRKTTNKSEDEEVPTTSMSYPIYGANENQRKNQDEHSADDKQGFTVYRSNTRKPKPESIMKTSRKEQHVGGKIDEIPKKVFGPRRSTTHMNIEDEDSDSMGDPVYYSDGLSRCNPNAKFDDNMGDPLYSSGLGQRGSSTRINDGMGDPLYSGSRDNHRPSTSFRRQHSHESGLNRRSTMMTNPMVHSLDQDGWPIYQFGSLNLPQQETNGSRNLNKASTVIRDGKDKPTQAFQRSLHQSGSEDDMGDPLYSAAGDWVQNGTGAGIQRDSSLNRGGKAWVNPMLQSLDRDDWAIYQSASGIPR